MSVVESSGGEGSGSSSRSDDDEERMWVIMRRKVEMVGLDVLINGERALLDVAAPPMASLFAVNRDVLPGPSRIRSSGFIHCCDDRSGLILFAVTGGGASAKHYFFVFDAWESSVLLLPEVPDSLLLSLSSDRMGLIADRARGGGGGGCRDFVTAQLHAKQQQESPILLTFHSRTSSWSVNQIAVSALIRVQIAMIEPDFVISNSERLVFVDLKHGLLVVDPFVEGVAARFVALPPPPGSHAGAAEANDPRSDLGRSRCVTVCNGKLHFFRLDGLPEPPTISSWQLLDADDSEGQDWHRLYSISLDIWPLLTRFRDSPGIAVANPRSANVVYLSAGEMFIAVDLNNGDVVQSGVFFPEANSMASTDVCAWIAPPRPTKAITIINLRKRLLRKLRKGMSKVAIYVKNNPDLLITAGSALESYADYIPVDMTRTRAGTTYLGKALSGAGNAIKWRYSGAQWLKEVAELEESCGSIYHLVTVRTPDAATDTIASWVASGKPMVEFRVQFPDELSSQDKAKMHDLFVSLGAEELLHQKCDKSDGEWHMV